MQHGLTGLCWGTLVALALVLAVMAISFLLPLAVRNAALLACFAVPPLGGIIGLLWPVSLMRSAQTADACGLRERTQTALALADRQDEMARLQRDDALRALRHLDIRQALPLRAAVKPLIAAGGCAAAALALFFIPNPQDAVLRQQAQFRQKMEKPAEAIEKAAGQLDETTLGEKTVQELRRLLGDLARETRDSGTPREALKALSQGQQRLEKKLSESRGAAMDALGQAGLDSLAQSLEAGGQSLEEALEKALEGQDAQSLSAQLNAVAQAAADAAASAALREAAGALSQGSAAQAAQALGQLSAAGLAQGQAAAALQSAKAMAGGQGQSQGMGQGQGKGSGMGSGQGQGAGAGAGQGSTNQDMSGSGGRPSGSNRGGQTGGYKLGEYEAIYDPTRLGDGGQVTQSTGRVDENAQISEMTLGPGLGDASGSVPYDQVVGAYQSAAVQRAREAALPGYAQQWVADYFSALTE